VAAGGALSLAGGAYIEANSSNFRFINTTGGNQATTINVGRVDGPYSVSNTNALVVGNSGTAGTNLVNVNSILGSTIKMENVADISGSSMNIQSVSNITGVASPGMNLNQVYTINGTVQQVLGSFTTTNTYPVALPNTPRVLPIDNTLIANGMRISGTGIEVDYSGVYEINFSIQLDKSGGGTDFCDFWLRVNGTDVPESGSQITVQGSQGECLANLSVMLPLFANDIFEIVFASPDASMAATYFPAWTTAGGDPYDRPSIPSLILTLKLIK
jgi:hypothetical protein